MVERAYEHGKALHVAEYFEIDDVIDPADNPARMVHALESAGPRTSGRRAAAVGGLRGHVVRRPSTAAEIERLVET